jgi:hypothetical protein
MKKLLRLAMIATSLIGLTITASVNAEEDPALAQELLEVLKQRQGIYATDPNASGKVLESMWLDADNVVLVSEDFHQRFHGRDAVTPYFNPPKPNLYAYREIVSNPRATRLEEDLATVTYDLRYDMQPVGKPPMGGMSHMMTMFKKTNDGWKIQAELQLPMGLISQSRILQEMAVSPDFVDYARTQNPTYDEQVDSDKSLKRRKTGVIPWMLGGTSQPTLPSKDSEEGSGGD